MEPFKTYCWLLPPGYLSTQATTDWLPAPLQTRHQWLKSNVRTGKFTETGGQSRPAELLVFAQSRTAGVKGLNGPQASAAPFLREIWGGAPEAGGRWGLQYRSCFSALAHWSIFQRRKKNKQKTTRKVTFLKNWFGAWCSLHTVIHA